MGPLLKLAVAHKVVSNAQDRGDAKATARMQQQQLEQQQQQQGQQQQQPQQPPPGMYGGPPPPQQTQQWQQGGPSPYGYGAPPPPGQYGQPPQQGWYYAPPPGPGQGQPQNFQGGQQSWGQYPSILLRVAGHRLEVSLTCQARLRLRVISSNTTTKARQEARLKLSQRGLPSTCLRRWHPQARPQGKRRSLSRPPVQPMTHPVLNLLSTVVKTSEG
ncbi:hypothetical protein EHS25_008666 [Saitozyma podzolica]|uniref:Uncharacterized protein n=1 Tax=Saitozyma podzolica TaxID=1890683 RepID=A0A427YMH8_9TREE|nr:hypothetical protein EHS25_008666 [Saitozyma podzolica]